MTAPLLALAIAVPARAATTASVDAADSAAAPSGAALNAPVVRSADGLEYLVPSLAADPYRLDGGVRPYLHRLSVSPGFGKLGAERLFVLRAAYNPNSWLGYEASIGHNPNHAVQAIMHRFSAVVRKPLPGRFQPYASAGYGMTVVLPGRSINADPVTKNALTCGGGLEFYLRGDLAIRGEMLGMTVLGRQPSSQGLASYDYREATIALSFYRTLKP